MGNIEGKFSDQNSYVLSQQMIAAQANTRTDLNVILIENDQVKSTNVFLTGQALTNNAANPASAVTNVGAQVIGAGVGDGSIQPDGEPCFLGNTLFSYWQNNYVAQIPFARLYRAWHPDDLDFPRSLSFNDGGEKVKGEIGNVFKKIRYDYLHVAFSDDTADDVAPNHRYWTPDGYIAIKDLLGKYVYDCDDRKIEVLNIDEVAIPKGIDVYNAQIKQYENYCANKKRVHNRKDNSEFQ